MNVPTATFQTSARRIFRLSKHYTSNTLVIATVMILETESSETKQN
ncbi:hypothetical protein [Reichenbachiella sp. 5M10]|nr:hypothetical protein [Reichenbachiella sp. 5M10]